jgi:chorismate mutase/prephenate dehydratase
MPGVKLIETSSTTRAAELAANALFAALRPFDHWKISLRKIESRPSRRKAWEYFMYVDIEGHAEDRKVSAALKILREHCSVLKILGSYPCVDEAVK